MYIVVLDLDLIWVLKQDRMSPLKQEGIATCCADKCLKSDELMTYEWMTDD